MSGKLQNCVAEYSVPMKMYERELQQWTEKGRLIPYGEQKVGPPQEGNFH